MKLVELEQGVLFTDRYKLAEIATTARGSGVPVFVLTTDGGSGRGSFIDSARRALPLDPPLTSFRSWDALADSLWEGLSLIDGARIVLTWPDAQEHKAKSLAEYRLAVSILEDIVSTISNPRLTNGNPKMFSVVIEES